VTKRIDKVILHVGSMPTKVHFSYGSPAAFDFIIVRVVAGGEEGLGECITKCDDNVLDLARRLAGEDPHRLDGLLDDGRGTDGPVSHAATSVREMFSMALHDLVARLHQLPMHLLLGGARRKCIPLMPCIFPEDAADAERKAREFVAQGFRSLKVKIFGEIAGDDAIVRAVRRALPKGFIQADANRGYKSIPEAQQALSVFREIGLSAIEDPLNGSLEEYARLCGEFAAPRIILDAPSRGWDAIHTACVLGAAHAINLHPNCQGAFSEILGRAAVARAAGIQVMVGGTGYTGIGSHAYAHVASVVGLDFPYGELCGAVDHGMPASAAQPLPVEQGNLVLAETGGHGGRLNLSAIEPYVSETIEAG